MTTTLNTTIADRTAWLARVLAKTAHLGAIESLEVAQHAMLLHAAGDLVTSVTTVARWALAYDSRVRVLPSCGLVRVRVEHGGHEINVETRVTREEAWQLARCTPGAEQIDPNTYTVAATTLLLGTDMIGGAA